MSKNVMEDILDLVCTELETISAKKALDATSLNNLDTLIDIKKDILEIMEKEAFIQPEMNGNSYSMAMSSYANRMGHGRNSYEGYSSGYGHDRGYLIQPYYNQGYSRASSEQEMIQHLRTMAESMNPQKRDMTYDFIRRLEGM